MNPLIAIVTCWSNIAAADAIRKTWAKSSPLPIKFFLGQPKKGFPRAAQPDEVFVAVPDTYEGLVHKVKTAFRWARANGFTHVWKADDDVYLVPDRLLKSGLLQRDHVGMWAQPVRRVSGDVECVNGFIHGGASYLVGERALPVLCESPVNTISEDWWATYHVERAGMKSTPDARFQYTRRIFGDEIPAVPAPENDLIATGELHTLVGGKSELYAVHRRMVGD